MPEGRRRRRMYGKLALCFIEWPDKIEELLPYDCVNVHIAETENGARSITLDI